MVYTPIYTSTTECYAKSGLTSSEVDLSTYDTLIEAAEIELEALTGRKWSNANAKTEFLDGPNKDVIGYNGQQAVGINVSEMPIQSITEFKTLDVDGNTINTYALLTSVQIAAGTFSNTDYWLDTIEDTTTHLIIPYGRIVLKDTEFTPGIKNIKVAYTYGYTTVPVVIKHLASALTGLRMWTRFMGGNYNYLTSYSIPQQSVNKGDLYARGQQMIQTLTEEANRLLDRVGRRPRTLFVASGKVR